MKRTSQSKSKRSRALAAAAAMAVVATTLLACSPTSGGSGGSTSTEIRFSMWAAGPDVDVWNDIIESFEKANPDISVKFEPLDYQSYWTKLNTQMASNSAPDVVGMQFQSGVLGQAGQLIALDELSADFEKVPENLLKSGQTEVDGENVTYALPMRFVGGSIYGNTSAMEAAGVEVPEDGWTIDEFVAAAKAMTTDDMYGIAIPGTGPGVAFASLFDASPVSDDGRTATYDTPEMIEYKTWLRDLIYVEKVAPHPKDVSAQKDPFVTEQVAMTLNGSWMTGVFREGVENFDWDILPNPSGEFQGTNYAGPDLISVTSSSKHPDAAQEFIKYVVFDPDAQTIIANVGAPVLTELLTDEERIAAEAAQGPANYGYFVQEAVEHGGGWAFGPKFTDISIVENEADYKIFESADSDVEAILTELDVKVQALLDTVP
ncbi:sugar ABC transporter substrate-binding protein [Microbacterium sp. W4I20]|uniref:ABC transporter substrate-binding protein n=1 Tax=Microbacterium sp. W4I20 TaxID=3042262 RepID=UPI002788F639|nr:sugar ABC transporter substrate-binding protein [Microbacterium sp. W4I20]MDQ0726726.1 multiple sugar transport system substrate-binding protein [Microbacterium sp. W4I20]